jgi:hypothetical protein
VVLVAILILIKSVIKSKIEAQQLEILLEFWSLGMAGAAIA